MAPLSSSSLSASAATATPAADVATAVPVQISSCWAACHQHHVNVGEGLISLVGHALQLCAHAARCSVQDLQTSPWAWTTTLIPTTTTTTTTTSMTTTTTTTTTKMEQDNDDYDDDDQQQQWTYVQHALIYHRQHLPTTRKAAQDDLDAWLEHWGDPEKNIKEEPLSFPPYLLGRISLYFVASHELTEKDLKPPNGKSASSPGGYDEDDDDYDDDDNDDYDEEDEEDDYETNSRKKKKRDFQATVHHPSAPDLISSSFWQPGLSPSVLLYHANVEYRSLPATGNPWAVQAEAWTMMTWGQGSPLDEELKGAALAGLSDPHAKYVLEIDSVRGKRYQFDWMPATSPPPLISVADMDDDDDYDEDGMNPITNRNKAFGWAQCLGVRVSDQPESSATSSLSSPSSSSWALTRMQYRLDPDATPREAIAAATMFPSSSFHSLPSPKFFSSSSSSSISPSAYWLHRTSRLLQHHFLQLRPHPPTQLRAVPSGHALLLLLTPDDDTTRGQIYWKGRFWKNWSKVAAGGSDDNADDVWNHVPALFGMNLNASFPLSPNYFKSGNNNGGGSSGGGTTTTSSSAAMISPLLYQRQRGSTGIGDSPKRRSSANIVETPFNSASPTTLLKQAYAVMWQELLIDARYGRWNLAGKLLNRLIYDADGDEDDADDDDDDDDDIGSSKQRGGGGASLDDKNNNNNNSSSSNTTSGSFIWPQRPPPSANVDCLESIVLQSTLFDPVGIAAKALATHFAKRYGQQAFPCLNHEIEWVQHELPGRSPIVVVPQRTLNVLRRGGYFDVARTKQDTLAEQKRRVITDELSFPDRQENVLHLACTWLDQAAAAAEGSGSTAGFRILQQDRPWHQLVVLVPSQPDHQPICRFDATLQVFQIRNDFFTLDWSSRLNLQDISAVAYLLGMYMAQVHPTGSGVLAQYVLQHANLPTTTTTTETTNSQAKQGDDDDMAVSNDDE